MNENLNLVEILKDCPKGTKLYSMIYGEVEFERISKNERFPIIVKACHDYVRSFSAEGKMYYDMGECILFPSREQRDWSKFNVKSNNSKFDPKTFQPFDKVLVKYGDKSYHVWFPDFISLPPNDDDETVLCMTTDDVFVVIPYNEETKHLVGTNKEAPEFYRYWEE